MNKQHWNMILTNGRVKDALLREWINESYDIIVNSLPKKAKEELKNL